jgi:hypothetical protein
VLELGSAHTHHKMHPTNKAQSQNHEIYEQKRQPDGVEVDGDSNFGSQ